MAYTDYHWINDYLAIGGLVAEPEILPFDAILSLETHAPAGLGELVRSGRVEYQWRSIIDGVSHETDQEIVRRFDSAADQIHEWLRAEKRVLVHCYAGVSRSVTAVIWYLIRYEQHTWDEALHLIRRAREIANPNIRFEIPLRLALGERLSDYWIDQRIEAYCRKMRADLDVEIDAADIRESLVRQGTLAPQSAAS